MRSDRQGQPFLVIGENIHATRVLKRAGRHAVDLPGGGVGIGFDDGGERRVLPVHPTLAAAKDFANGRIKHVASAVHWGLEGGEHAETAAAYIRVLAARQEAAGADWLDLNADEVSSDSAVRAQAIAWLVTVVEATATVPVAIDSSDVAVMAAGAAASDQPQGRLLLNSASLERPEVLDIAETFGTAVVLACSSPSGIGSSATRRAPGIREDCRPSTSTWRNSPPLAMCIAITWTAPAALRPPTPSSSRSPASATAAM